ncbi:CHAT domain-containing protein [Sorangium sp. So ce1182]|uniref:CHAT domain-containing protein n=1 Tax=Sorangium sp. So ce1182 TaxID=3133334 RepID=UPI003F60A722
MWLEIELDISGTEVRVSARGSRGERPPAHAISPEHGFDALQTFASKVGRAVRGGKSLDAAAVSDSQVLHEEVFKGELRDVLVRLGEASKGGPLLVRLFVRDQALQAIPWEALCRPGTSEGFLGTDPRVLFARGVTSSEPWEPREVRGAVRLLGIAPGTGARALDVLREALAPAIDAGEVEWLDPIAGQEISARALFDRLRRGKSPHVVHWLGHGGVDLSGKPVLRLADDEDGEETWITAEALGRELSAAFCEELRLVILEACEGARAGALGSAAEILARAGADAVVAHLWPVRADVARACSTELYRALTGASVSQGDIGASVAAARRTLLSQSAEAFSPVLYLRGSDSVVFNFQGRRVARPGKKSRSRALAPALQSLLERPFTMVLGDLEDDRAALQRELEQFMQDNGEPATQGMSLSALTQRCVLRFGQEVLHSLFQQALTASPGATAPPLVDALARFVRPGVHITLLWRPCLEHAIAQKLPQRTVYAIQPSLLGAGGKPRIVKRAAGATAWKMEPVMPRRFDLESEIVVLRLYGGYSAEPRPIFSPPLLTEDDHIHGPLGADGARPPLWMEELLARPRVQPGLFVALSSLDFRHRMLLRWLYDQRPAPPDSLAVLAAGVESSEIEIWGNGGGLPGTGHIAATTGDLAELATQLDAFAVEDAS